MTRPLLDQTHLRDLFARLDPATAEGLLRRFVDEADTTVPLLGQTPPMPEFQRLAHRLAGSAATFGAQRLADLLANMADQTTGSDTLPELQAGLAETWASTRAALADARQGLAA